MISHRAIRRDFDAAGSVNALIALWGFVDDSTFITKAGDVGVVYRLHALDYEGMDHEARRAVVHRAQAALRLLDETFRVYHYLCKRRVPAFASARCAVPAVDAAVQARAAHLTAHADALFELDLYLVVVYEGLARTTRTSTRLERFWRDPRAALRAWLSPRTVLSLVEDDLNRALAALHHALAGVEVQLADTLQPERLSKADAFRFFRRLVNYTPAIADGAVLSHDTHLDYFVAGSSVACHRSHLEVQDSRVKVLTMADPPTATFAHIFEDLYQVPGEFIACLEWQRVPNDRMRRDIQSRRRHFYHQRVSMVNYLGSSERHPEDRPLVDHSAEASVDQLGDALTAMEVDGHFFGECSVTLVLYGVEARAVERAAAEALKVLAAHEGAFHDETYNLLNAWVSVVPGNSAHNLRRLPVLETHCADLSFLFGLDQGERTSPQLGNREALAVFQARHDTPYYYTLHVNDVGHTLVLGATGSGKSFLLNFLVTHAQKYEPRTVIFDLGHSYRKLAAALDASYLELGLHAQGLTINPFALPNTAENLHFLHAFVRVLLEGVDSYHLSDAEDRELYDAIANVYVLDADQRRLFTLANILPRGLGQRLSRWVGTGRYAQLFDHVEDTLTVHAFQVFDFDAMREYPELLEPLLFYVLHRVTAGITSQDDGAQLKLCVMDEAWRFIQHPMLRAYVQEALKTWRKRNAAMVLATQSVEDFAASALQRAVLESCPTTLLLANPALDRQQYADLFRLNALELDRLTHLAPRREFLLKRPHTSKVLTLDVDAASLALYATTPGDHSRRGARPAAPGLIDDLPRETVVA